MLLASDVQKVQRFRNEGKKEMVLYVYALCDPLTGDVRYIGKTENLERRYKEHLSYSGKKNYHQKKKN